MPIVRPLSFDDEMKFRRAAIEWLTVRTNDGAEAMYYRDIEDFEYFGERIPLRSRYKGIWKPSGFSAALSFTTKYTKPGKERPYEDVIGEDGLVRYKWREGGPDVADNRALRAAMKSGLPLIWFYGIFEGMYQAVFPVFIVGEEPEQQQVLVAIDEAQRLFEDGPIFSEGPSLSVVEKRYAASMARQRLHQPIFRSMVMQAYEERCAVCALNHVELLGAAHFIPGSHPEGVAAVSNALALCKIHHAAYDRRLLGIDQYYTVHIQDRLLSEVDGPMLKCGLQERHGEKLLWVPRARVSKPSRRLLGEAFSAFKKCA